jgi:hypothetical protein
MTTWWIPRKIALILSVGAVIAVVFGARYLAGPASLAAGQTAAPTVAGSSYERILRWPLPQSEKPYGDINGDRLKGYVNEIAELTRQHREPGAQYWGRITGTPVDAKMREWLMSELREVGVQEVREEPFSLQEPQYFPRSWDVTALAGGRPVSLSSVYPFRGSPSTPEAGLELEPVWVGLGTEADFAGRDVRGKAAVVYAQPLQSSHDDSADEFGSLARAREAGAAAILMILGIPGNFQHVMYGGEEIPHFTMGLQDGIALRELIEQGKQTRVRIKLNAEFVPGMKSATVWGTLPGATEEVIMITAHRDGFFEGAGDNASGVALMLGLAEHFAKIPAAQRRRTLRFMGATGHHHIGPNDTVRVNDNQELMSRTVVALNPEHTGWTETYTYGFSNRKANGTTPLRWYLRGSTKLRDVMFSAFDTFGVKTLQQPGPGGAGDVGRLKGVPVISVIQSPIFFHSNFDVPENVTTANLEAVARAFAKIVDEVNQLDKSDLVGPVTSETAEVAWDTARPSTR